MLSRIAISDQSSDTDSIIDLCVEDHCRQVHNHI